MSLFSGAGLSDAGYEMAGFRFVAQVEEQADRARLGRANFPKSRWIETDVRRSAGEIATLYRQLSPHPLYLLVATPPCQGMSSSNPSRGKRQNGQAKDQEEKNSLLLQIVPVALALSPRVIVVENVRQVLTLAVADGDQHRRMVDVIRSRLSDYHVFEGVVNVADYGIPQDRRRAIIVAVRRSEKWLPNLLEGELLPWPRPTHAQIPGADRAPWTTVRQWFDAMQYERLDAAERKSARGTHQLHFVPHYNADRYLMLSDIPAYTGRGAFQNDRCPACEHQPQPLHLSRCCQCGAVLKNRPHVVENGTARLIKGFKSSYRRMHPDLPAATVTTNSSHVGSDFKIHPWEHRVLSILECADLQTVPAWYDWSDSITSNRTYTVRRAIGEAFPPYFTYLHGQLLAAMLDGQVVHSGRFASALSPGLGHRKTPSATAPAMRDTAEGDQ
ncbi:MAG TPA: DNA cytosine methyltransferase [Armatimonadota bacterium]|nr:DNA cytosine methyltransferase [Armatimonadota bacterium]